jgi:hypothetical protein
VIPLPITMHTGQIILITKMLQPKDLNFYDFSTRAPVHTWHEPQRDLQSVSSSIRKTVAVAVVPYSDFSSFKTFQFVFNIENVFDERSSSRG